MYSSVYLFAGDRSSSALLIARSPHGRILYRKLLFGDKMHINQSLWPGRIECDAIGVGRHRRQLEPKTNKLEIADKLDNGIE